MFCLWFQRQRIREGRQAASDSPSVRSSQRHHWIGPGWTRQFDPPNWPVFVKRSFRFHDNRWITAYDANSDRRRLLAVVVSRICTWHRASRPSAASVYHPIVAFENVNRSESRTIEAQPERTDVESRREELDCSTNSCVDAQEAGSEKETWLYGGSVRFCVSMICPSELRIFATTATVSSVGLASTRPVI